MTTMTIGAAAADMAAGMAIRKVTPQRHGAVAGNHNRPSI
jgi:acyl-coenzyme A thioesterase PaaI-like protein